MINKKRTEPGAFFLALILILEAICFIASPGAYAAGDPERVYIESEEDLIELSERSGDNSYTEGKTFILKKDLDLSGKDMKPIQTFCGTFEGGGHSVSGFSYTGKLSDVGLFRSITKSGIVRDLKVVADILPTGDMKNVGGLSGINSGLIEGCTVDGQILGIEATGGIAGRNTENGRIKSSVNKALITGMRRTGGIAGYNEGVIESSENTGGINTRSRTAWEIDDERRSREEKELLMKDSESEDELPSNENLDKLIPDGRDVGYDDLLDIVKNDQEVDYTGGIAGVNSGEIKGSSNSSPVGYSHLGYKTGGIAGYDRGIIHDCENNGIIYGRKNTGGIAGQLEPYIRQDFGEDSFSKAENEADRLTELITSLQDTLKDEDDNVQERIDSLRNRADDLRGSINGYRDYYRGKDDLLESDMRSHTGAIRNIINGIDVNLKTGKTGSALSAIKDDLDKIDSLMAAAEKATSNGIPVDMSNYIGTVGKTSDHMGGAVTDLLEAAQNAGGEYNSLRRSAMSLRDETDSFDDFLRTAYDSYKTDLRGTDDDITSRVDDIASDMDALSDTLKKADSSLRSDMDDINDSIKTLTDVVHKGYDEAVKEIERIRETDDPNEVYDDISDSAGASPGFGKITGCINRGDVITDINGGGIAGMADRDSDLRSDFEVYSEGEVSFENNTSSMAAIVNCRNEGAVTVKNNCAGGIAGSMDVGAVINSVNFGPVSSLEGDYSGGITGKSGFMIRDSFSMAAVSGNKYVGGIAGFGRNITGNRTISTVPSSMIRSGAVAGDVERDKEKAGTVSGNVYVDDSVGAVNGITFENEAQAMAYEDFIRLPGIPEEAKSMTVTFMSEGRVIEKKEVPYGGSVAPEDYPELPQYFDRFGTWDCGELKNITQNTVVNVTYVSFVTTVASGEAFPVFLISGKFRKGDSVSYNKYDMREETEGHGMPAGYLKVLDKYSFSISGTGANSEEESYIRLLSDEYDKSDTAAVKGSDGSYEIIETARDGRYMVFPFDCTDMKGEFYILKAAPDMKKIVLLSSAAIAACIIILIVLVRKYGMKKAAASGDEREQPQR